MLTHDGPATLTDTEVLEFCKNGYLMLPGVVSEETNQRTLAYTDANPSHEPTEIIQEPWFRDEVLLNPAVAGAVRSLLGAHFALPNLMSSHRMETPAPAQGWHRDGGSHYTHELHYLQVFYLPQTCTDDMGPTEVLPGSHFLFATSPTMGHYGAIQGMVKTSAPAGSVFLTVYSIWHRRGASRIPSVRQLLKYNYWRTTPPTRDWRIEADFDLANAPYHLSGAPTFRPQFRDSRDSARMFFWLCGMDEKFHTMGGQGWPMPAKFEERPYGYPLAPERV